MAKKHLSFISLLLPLLRVHVLIGKVFNAWLKRVINVWSASVWLESTIDDEKTAAIAHWPAMTAVSVLRPVSVPIVSVSVLMSCWMCRQCNDATIIRCLRRTCWGSRLYSCQNYIRWTVQLASFACPLSLPVCHSPESTSVHVLCRLSSESSFARLQHFSDLLHLIPAIVPPKNGYRFHSL